MIEAESRLGNIYDPSNDACLDTRYELKSSSDVMSINSDQKPVIYSNNGALVDQSQSVTVLQLTGSATNTFGFTEVDVSWSFTPGCGASPITTSLNPSELLVTIGTSLDFTIKSTDFSYQYKQDWIDLGYADGCTIDIRLEGSAAAFSTLSGDTVSVAPDSGVTAGTHDLKVVAFYSGSTFGETTPLSSPTLTVTFDIVAERAVEIEVWPM